MGTLQGSPLKTPLALAQEKWEAAAAWVHTLLGAQTPILELDPLSNDFFKLNFLFWNNI